LNLKGKKILVTGGAGFIGSHVADRLVEMKTQVVLIDNFQGGRLQNLDKIHDKIELINGDVRDKNTVVKAIKDADIVFHFAANASVPNSIENPRYDFETNAIGTFNLLEAAVSSPVKKFIYASSAAVYGEPIYTPISESHPLNPVSPYGVSKLSGEKMGIVFGKIYGLDFISIRIFNTYGPRQPRYVMYDFFQKLKQNPEKLEVLGTGNQMRDLCYINDAVDALMLVAEKGKDCYYNLASGTKISIRELAELFVSLMSPKANVVYTGNSWKGDIEILTANIANLRKLGFEPKVSLREGVKATIEWFMSQSNN